MKRVIAVSDSHGAVDDLKDAFEQARRLGKIDVAVFLGDGLRDFQAIAPILTNEGITCYSVPGNNDLFWHGDRELCFLVGKVRFFISHGHHLQVRYGIDRLFYAAEEHEAQVALYGHSHHEKIDLERGLYFINPGAVCERSKGRSAYAEILVEDNGYIRASLVAWM